MSLQEKLVQLKRNTATPMSVGLPRATIEQFAKQAPDLERAVDVALEAWKFLSPAQKALANKNEAELVTLLGERYLNFYEPETLSPYIPLGAAGPWIITINGAVIYDAGGYGIYAFGHNPPEVLHEISKPQVMANVMTANFAQERFANIMEQHVSLHQREAWFHKLICMNSGSEAMGVATRISDLHAKKITNRDGKYPGRETRFLSLIGSFHGRTTRPARASHSTRKIYESLASFRRVEEHVFVEPNNKEQLREVFGKLSEQYYIECLAFEPVMGEGNPGYAIERDYYDLARQLTKEHGSFLLIDSIQAGLRAHGVLSIVDYPGFEGCDPPDMECYSKAINAGQFPLSVLALNEFAASNYLIGSYGNTMTTNPRALDVGSAVLEKFDQALRENISAVGAYFLGELKKLQSRHPALITRVQGTGLLVSLQLRDDILVVAEDGVETRLRKRGLNVIHSKGNCLRYTPHFRITKQEADLIVELTEQVLTEYAS